ncbi:phage major capsid protein, HK97 family [Meinhardsimonia xiamenensis]|jgi:HK97 family phage major capsid protein|uniref:Phage major capsid protein, HK97 family n=1 Tax=Meinhardsimonia xiamenensis TaxID=990712 RepID=A0A1G9FBM2_9RHOB|nr:phage major capsid protein [Meinhardsimonia xiamenensis]PRX37911.1 HK97 family phage major capsid protein [Meinhardsimonia xiamenensis]SDK85775.1 phage major capsid protein, HK97 family [Meinhardsimonia xiamenensis]
MLDSVKIARRQSEIRQKLSELVGKQNPTEDETRQMEELDREYRSNETRYRAALIAEDQERREAGADLETRSSREWAEIMAGFEVRQVALALDEGRSLDGQTAEIVSELRSRGGYRGIPLPWEALEIRAGETVASGTPDPIRTAPIIERLFARSVAARMGGQMINVDVGEVEYPVTTSSVTAGWAASETGNVTGPSAYTTVDRPLKPDYNLGIQMRITRKTLKQSGSGLEQAVRRDMNGAIEEALDRAVFLGSGASGEPTGLFAGASAWGISEQAVGAAPTWGAFRSEVVSFITGNAASGPGDVRLLIRPEVWDAMDASIWDAGSGITEWDRLSDALGVVTMSHNALADPAGSPLATSAVMTTTAGGVPPFFVGTWGAIDLIRDPYSDAQSGALRITALATMDVTISRAVQTRILTDIQ